MIKKYMTLFIAIVALMFASCSDNDDSSSDKGSDTKKTKVEYGAVHVNQSRNSRYINSFEVTKAKVTVSGLDIETDITGDVTITNTKGSFTIKKVPVGNNRVITVQAYKGSSIVPGEVLYAVVAEVKKGDNAATVDRTTSAKGKVYAACIKAGVADFKDVDAAIPSDTDAALIDADAIAADKKAGSLKAASNYKMSTATVEFDMTKEPASSGRAARRASRADGDGITMYFKKPAGFIVWFWEDGGLATAELMGYSWASPPSTKDCGVDGWSKIDVPGDKITGKMMKIMPNKSNEQAACVTSADFWWDGTSSTATKPSEFTGSTPSTPDTPSEPDTPSKPTTPTTPTESTVSTHVSIGTVVYISDPLSVYHRVMGSAKKIYKTDLSGAATETVVSEETKEGKLLIYGVAPGTWKVYKQTDAVLNDNGGYDSGSFTVLGSVTVGKTGTKVSQDDHNIILGEKGEDVKDDDTTGGGDDSGGGDSSDDTKPDDKPVVDDGPATPSNPEGEAVATEYYWTNKNGAVGTEKTISDWSDWTAAERIAQCAAYDDPRTWRGIQESPYDCYAIYAAYDDTNIYLMVELTNCATAGRATFMNHDYAGGDNSDWDNRDIPLGWAINTGKGEMAKNSNEKGGKPIWDAVKFSDSCGFNYLTYHSSKCTAWGKYVGTPGWFKYNKDAGAFDYGTDYTTTYGAKGTCGVDVCYQNKLAVSSKVWFEATPTGNRAESKQTAADLMSSTNYKDAGPATGSKDCSYWYKIPYTALGIDKAWIKTQGIGVRQLTTGGGSLMDCCPWDPAMVDVVDQPYSQDESTSAEKEDEDKLTTPQARVGHM